MLKLRTVCEDDCQLLWEWANDPEVRAVSFSSEPIPWEQHVRWFHTKAKDIHCLLFIATDSTEMPIGQVRCDVNEDEAVMSISIDRQFRGRGYGSLIIRLASQQIFDTTAVQVVRAYVKPVNQASARAFLKAQFRQVGTATVRGQQAIHFVMGKGKWR